MNHCFECVMEMWDCSAHWCQTPSSQDGCFLAALWSNKGWWLQSSDEGAWVAELGRMQQPQHRSSNYHPLQGKLSTSSLPLSNLINRYCMMLPNFCGNLNTRQPGTSLPPHNPDPRQHTALPPRHLGGCEDTKKCALCCRDAGDITPVQPHGGPGSAAAAGVCPWVALFSLVSQKKASTGLSLTPGRAVHFNQIPSR